MPETQALHREVAMSRGTGLSWLMVVALAVFTGDARGSGIPQTLAIVSTVHESGFVGGQNLGVYPLAATPYDFSGQLGGPFLSPIARVDALFLTLTIAEGDTAPGDF